MNISSTPLRNLDHSPASLIDMLRFARAGGRKPPAAGRPARGPTINAGKAAPTPRPSRLAAAACLLIFCAALHAYAQSVTPTEQTAGREVRIVALPTPPRIDGVLEAGEWSKATRVEMSHQTEPGDNIAASERTEVFLGYDREHLYVAFHAYDSHPAAIRAPVSKRDAIDNDDYVALFLDTYDDHQRAYRFAFNPLGVQEDGIFTESNPTDTTWDGLHESKGTVTADGYIVEVSIPFKTLRFRAGRNSKWGLHLQRYIARKAERDSWMPISRDRSGLLIQAGSLTGLDGIYAGRTLDVIPTLTGSVTGERRRDVLPPYGARLHNVNRLQPGLTAIYAIAPNLILSATLEPDFSQVEADVPQISVNQRFPLFFPEKRPFFLEGSEFFGGITDSSLTLLDTRQIVDPQWGIKLTGKVGHNSFGFLSASDRAPGLRVAAGEAGYGRSAQFDVLRYQRDVGKDSVAGVFVTDTRFAGSSNTVVAAEARFRVGEANTIGGQLIYTRTKTVNGEKKHGLASALTWTQYGRHWRIFTHDYYVPPDYYVQAGFIDRTGFHEDLAEIGYEWRPKRENGWLVSVWPFVQANRSRTSQGRPELNHVSSGIDFVLRRGISFGYLYSANRDGFAGGVFSYRAQRFRYGIDRYKWFTFSGRVAFGTGINFDPSHPAVGDSLSFTQDLTLRPSRQLSSEFLWLGSRLDDRRSGRTFLKQYILHNRTIYQLTQSHALRSIVEYDTAARRLGLSLLYAYTPRPNTALYVGYNDTLFNGLDPLDERRAAGLFRQSRTLFAKMSYSLRF